MEQKGRQAVPQEALYRMESITPDLMDKMEHDGDLDGMMSSDDDDQIISSASKMKQSEVRAQSELFGDLP